MVEFIINSMLYILKKHSADLLFAVSAGADMALTLMYEKRKISVEKFIKDGAEHSNHLTHLINFLYNYRIAIIILLITVAIILKVYESYDNRSDLRRSMKSYLDRVHKRYFCKDVGVADPGTRITYFTPQRTFPYIWLRDGWKPCLGKRLAMEVRSSELYQDSDVRIQMSRIKYKVQGKKAKSSRMLEGWDGVVGEAWCTGVTVTVEGLPDYKNANKTQKKEYKKKSNLIHKTDVEFDKFSMRPVSIIGVAIRDRESNKTGVLVIESMESKIIDHIARCNSGIAGRTFTGTVFNDIIENVQCIRG